jgi:hypothetical protein
MMCELTPDAQAIFFHRRHQPRRPPLAKIRNRAVTEIEAIAGVGS